MPTGNQACNKSDCKRGSNSLATPASFPANLISRLRNAFLVTTEAGSNSRPLLIAALERKESRGAQFRKDYPGKDEAAGKFNIVLRKVEKNMEVRREPVAEMRPDLRQIIEEMR